MATVLVIGDYAGVRDALDLMLVDGTAVRWAVAPDETEGLDVDVVVIGPGMGDLDAVRVHPRLGHLPVVALADSVNERPVPNTWIVASGRPAVIDDLADRIQWLIARARHPASQQIPQVTPAA